MANPDTTNRTADTPARQHAIEKKELHVLKHCIELIETHFGAAEAACDRILGQLSH